MFNGKLTTLTVKHDSGDVFKEQIYLPEVANSHNLEKIQLIEDPACKEVKAAYNADKHKIGVTVVEMPLVEKHCTVTVLVISKGKSTITYQ